MSVVGMMRTVMASQLVEAIKADGGNKLGVNVNKQLVEWATMLAGVPAVVERYRAVRNVTRAIEDGPLREALDVLIERHP